MKFSLWLFKDWYEKQHISLSAFISNTDLSIERIILYDGTPVLTDSHTAIVFAGHQLDNCSGFRSALVCGSDRLLFPVTSSETIFNIGNDMMDSYCSWELEMHDLILSGTPVSSLLNAAQNVFHYPLAICRKNGALLYHSDNWTLTFQQNTLEELDSCFQLQNPPGQTFFLTPGASQADTLIAAVESSGSQQWALIACDRDGRIQPADTHLFLTLLHLLEAAVQYESDQTISLHPMSRWYAKQLTDPSPEGSSHPFPADSGDWGIDDYYLIACIQADDIKLSGYPELISEITDRDNCCVLNGDILSVLIHLGKDYPKDISAAKKRITSHCRRFRIKIGFSLFFRRLLNLWIYHKQSLQAVSEAQNRNVTSFSLEDALPKYLLRRSRSLPEIQAYIHPQIRLLAEADRTGNDELLHTLYTYIIHGCSASHTADVLFIHRNTLRNRLNKIRDIISPDLEDEAQLEHILLSLIISPQNL